MAKDNIKLPTIVVTVKNRLDHFLKTFSFNISQIGAEYNLLYVDYDSEDGFSNRLVKEIEYKKDIFSKYLQKISLVKLKTTARYDIRRAKNLGAFYASRYSNILLISDADTMLGMNYLKKWSSLVEPGSTFITNRSQDNRSRYPKRLSPEVNYGNIVVATDDFLKVKGYDEKNIGWGGDDDDLFHRLKNMGLREINPHSVDDALQYSIMHEDDLRFKDTEFPEMIRPSKIETEAAFEKIYSNNKIQSEKSDYMDEKFVKIISKETILYDKKRT